METTKRKETYGYIPYPLRYKERKDDNGKLVLTSAIFVGTYLLFISLISVKLGFL